MYFYFKRKVNQFKTLIIEEVDHTTSADAPAEHGHNFYEIIYVRSGEGTHFMNKVGLPYNSGDLFLLSPEDEHFFQISKPTKFAIVRFTDHYFTQKRHLTSDQTLVSHPEELMRNKLLKEKVVYQPQLIQIKEIAAHFNISPNYFSTFFKKNFGMAYLEYVHNYKIGLIEKRITSGQASFKQIAEEFGFADERHLTKFFRQMKNINPADYRKNLKVS